MKSVLRTAAGVCALALSLGAYAQYYCPSGTTYYTSNYGSSCTLGTCWSTTQFPGSQSAAPLGYPGWYYACATDGPPPPLPPAGRITYFKYDNQGNVKSVDGPLSGTADTTTSLYDALNRVSRVTDPNAGQVNYGYDVFDQLISVSDPRSLLTSYGIDGLGNLNQQVSPDTGTTANTFDAAGNLVTSTDAKSQNTTHVYDALNRVTLITFHDGSKQAYAYDSGTNGLGRLSSITETNPALQVTSLIAYGYDSHGRVTSETRTLAGIPYATAYRYDSFGRRDRITYPSGRTVDLTFDSVGRVNSVTTTPSGGSAQAIVTGVTYYPFGGLTGFTFGNAQTYSRTVDLDGRIASYTLGSASYGITFDPASRITGITETGNPPNTNTYGYDLLDRLTSAVLPATNYGYSYDGVGNRLTKTTGAATDTYAYSSTSNQIASVTPASGPVKSFTFDPNGSTVADSVNNYTYDARGRMVRAVGSFATDYYVNALGQRVRKTTPSADTVFTYDSQGHLIAETTAAGATLKEYVWLADTPVAVIDANGIYYIHADHLNTPRLVANATGVPVWRWDQMEPFGNTAPDDNPSGLGVFDLPLRLPGQYFDKETNLHYNYFRDYDPVLGRFAQSDPIGLDGGTNTYAYVGVGPLMYADPWGLAKCVYYIAEHTLICYSNDGTKGVASSLPSSGLGACQNDPKCANLANQGPVPPDSYAVSPNTLPARRGLGWWALQSKSWIPNVSGALCYLGWGRCGYNIHLGVRSLGCITFPIGDPNAQTDFANLTGLLKNDGSDNSLTVLPNFPWPGL